MTEPELENRFTYHKPNSEKIVLHENLRENCWDLAIILNEMLPESREKSLAITKVEEAMFWANACVARLPIGQE